MPHETMDLDQLAHYLQRDARELHKLASRGHLPARKVGGEWRFAKAEVNHWLETQLPEYDEQQLTAVESATVGTSGQEPLIASLLSEATMAVPLAASTRGSVFRELVRLAEQSWQVYDPEALLHAIQQREEMASTALPNGVAIPHPRRPMPNALGEPIMAFGRTASGVPFGSDHGNLTDIYFLVACRDDRTHLHVLARLSRLLLRPGILDELRAASTTLETWRLIETAERELIES